MHIVRMDIDINGWPSMNTIILYYKRNNAGYRSERQAKWFIKVDIYAVFYKIHIVKGDKYLTVFYMRFGLFEWLIIPFGLTGAPIMDFAIIYLDDVFIYTLGLREDYMGRIKDILRRL
ncbi:hypothetical protein UVI_02047580 [Ustilaginoidea virens]|uniref:Reverse transcriptase domain-containing protein n=1 Tax=Ustilaginoidea virens TaxID=1159556 RepID=A0A1B5LAM5_USTVR|nr:hypothetical protein UVI_02047580 [Ustilaginoidea virens]